MLLSFFHKRPLSLALNTLPLSESRAKAADQEYVQGLPEKDSKIQKRTAKTTYWMQFVITIFKL